jgi:hypothetical protein
MVSREKSPWEDPSLTMERELMARAQDGPGDSLSNQGFMGPLNISGAECLATPTP